MRRATGRNADLSFSLSLSLSTCSGRQRREEEEEKSRAFQRRPFFFNENFSKKTQSATRRESNAATLQRCGQNLLPLCAA
jgi:hypothetical protein